MEATGLSKRQPSVSSSTDPETKGLRASVVVEEYHGTAELTARWTRAQDSASTSLIEVRERRSKSSLWRNIQGAFLPEGYPDSVTHDYLTFQMWDTIQALSSYIRGQLSTQAVLEGIGVGGAQATVLGATFMWFVRDFTGMLGGIVFAHLQGSRLDSSAKQWRLAADILNDFGMLMDLISPRFPRFFLALLCLGSICRAITGTASGATRAALTQHFAVRQNAADISAKEGSQETMATLVGMSLGALVARLTAGSHLAVWTCFLSLMMLHVYANYRAMRCLCLNSLNLERTAILVDAFLQHEKILSPTQVSAREHILPLPLPVPSSSSHPPALLFRRVRFGAQLSGLRLHSGSAELAVRVRHASTQGAHHFLVPQPNTTVAAILHRTSSSADLLRAFVHALVLLQALDSRAHRHTSAGGAPGDSKAAGRGTGGAQKRGGQGHSRGRGGGEGETDGRGGGEADTKDVVGKAEEEAERWMRTSYEDFIQKLASTGWVVQRVLLAPGEWRANWLLAPSVG